MKINGDMTLFELQEHCKSKRYCSECDCFDAESGKTLCLIRSERPAFYNLYKPKTYKEYFLEKFPNARVSIKTGDPILCLMHIYGETVRPSICNYYHCNVCWNRVMPEEE